MRVQSLYALALIGCTSSIDKDFYTPIDTDTAVESDTDTDADTDSDVGGDTDLPGTDMDGDGFSVEEGDCDDDDIWVNPGWPEDVTDAKDNDCDGRIDEKFAGLLVADIDMVGTSANRFREISAFGDELGDAVIGGDSIPIWMAEKATFNGWYAYDPITMTVWDLANTGAASLVASLEEADVGLEENSFSYVGAHPDGFALVSAFDRIIQVSTGVDPTVAAEWVCDLESDIPDCILYLPSLAVDRLSGDVFLVGYIGGLAKWNPTTGLQTLIENNLEQPTHVFWAAEAAPGGDVYALGQDQATAQTGIFRYDTAANSWALVGEWPYSLHTLDNFTIEDETGDFYVALHYGWSQQVWRMLADGSYAAELFNTGNVNENRRFYDLGVLWDQK